MVSTKGKSEIPGVLEREVCRRNEGDGAMATKSQIVSWMGVALGVVQGFLKEVQKLGGGDEEVRKLVTPEGEALLAKFAQMLVGASASRQIFKFLVDRTKTLAEMITDGKYDWVDSNIIQENFPISAGVAEEEELALFHFNRNISSDDAIAEMEKAGYEPGDIADLLAFGKNQPELQRQFPIVALKSVWRRPRSVRCVPYLYECGTERDLRLHYFWGDWDDYSRFLARRKYQK